MKRAAPLMLVVGLILAAAPPAGASTTTIQMDNFQFDPTPVAVAMGDTVKWHAVDTTHTATSNSGLFDLTLSQGQSKSKAFKFAGTFPYYCRFHGAPGQGMHGVITLPATWVNAGIQHPGDVQRIRISSVKAPPGIAFDVQIKRPGDATFGKLATRITTAVVKFIPTTTGEYLVRSREHVLSGNKVSGWSPSAAVEIS